MPNKLLGSIARLAGHKGEVLCLDAPCIDDDGGGSSASTGSASSQPMLVSGGEDGTVRIWDLQAGRASRAIMVPATEGTDPAVTAVCLGTAGANDRWVYAATAAGIFGYDLRAPGMLLREPARRFAPSRDEIGQLALHSNGVLAAADDAGEVRVYDVGSTGELLATLTGGHTSLCCTAAFRPGRPWELYSAGLDALCVRWDWKKAVPMASWPLARLFDTSSQAQLLNPRHAHCLSFAPDGGTVAIALGDGTIEVRLAETGEPIAAVDAHRAAASQARFSPQLRAALVVRAREEMSSIADASTSAEAASALDAAASCEGLASGSALPLLSAGNDRQLRLWAVQGVVGRGAGGRGGDGGDDHARSKRPCHVSAAAAAVAAGDCGSADGGDGSAISAAFEDAEDVSMDEDEDEVDDVEPGFRALASVTLPEKPNWAVGVRDPSTQRGVVCVATTGSLVEVLRV